MPRVSGISQSNLWGITSNITVHLQVIKAYKSDESKVFRVSSDNTQYRRVNCASTCGRAREFMPKARLITESVQSSKQDEGYGPKYPYHPCQGWLQAHTTQDLRR